MKLDKRVTGGLAWAGLALVVAVPAADAILARATTEQALNMAPAADVAEVTLTAGPKPEVEKAEVAAVDPVTRFVESGKKLPAYLTGPTDQATEPEPKVVAAKPPEPTRVTPAATQRTATKADTPAASSGEPKLDAPESEVAVVDHKEIQAPIPMPASMRPLPPVRKPSLVGQERAADSRILQGSRDLRSDDLSGGYADDDIVTADELEEWETGPLSEFLAERQNGRRAQPAFPPSFEDDSFFIIGGPNY